MIVADASLVVDLLYGGWRESHELVSGENGLAAPHLLDVEVTSAIRRLTLAGELSPDDAARMLRRFGLLPIDRYSHGPLLTRIWELRHQLSVYDAAYAALAEQQSLTLCTLNARLAHTHGIRCPVKLVGLSS